MPTDECAALEAEILERYGSIYQFSKQLALNRSTVYMVLRGNYPGNSSKQLTRIYEALHGSADRTQQVFMEIKRVACERCAGRRRGCSNCDQLFREQAQAVLKLFSS